MYTSKGYIVPVILILLLLLLAGFFVFTQQSNQNSNIIQAPAILDSIDSTISTSTQQDTQSSIIEDITGQENATSSGFDSEESNTSSTTEQIEE